MTDVARVRCAGSIRTCRCPRTPIRATPAPTWSPPKTWSSPRAGGPWCRTGVAIALPDGYVGLVHPRSGLAARLGVTVLNAPGTVDAGYRGEILVNLVNHDPETTAKIARGDRIAQLVVQRVERAQFHVVDELPDSVRGAGGHGSTGGYTRRGPATQTQR